MATKKPKGLGRGLEALLGPAANAADHAAPDATVVVNLRLDQMAPGVYQPRTRMDESALQELAESIKAQGVLQPITVRRLDPGAALAKNAEYEIVYGHRRWNAARLAGLDSIPALISDVSNEAAAAQSLIENIQREDLNPLEVAKGLQRLVSEFGLTHETVAREVGLSRSAASNLLRLLNLTEPVQIMLMAGDLDMGHARALLSLDKGAQITAANQIVGKKMSVREAEALVKKLSAEFNLTPPARRGAEKSRDLLRVEEELSDLLAAEVEVRIKKRTRRGRRVEESGELAIHFGSLDALNGLIDRIRRAA
jgi:ParB family chromosome partitioning protein